MSAVTALPLVLAAIMFGMGLALTPAAFAAFRRAPGLAFVDLAALCIGLPLLAVAIGVLFQATPETRLGLLLIGSCPAGTLSIVATSYARGDLALSVLLMATTSLLSVLVTPAALHILGPLAGAHPGSVVLPWDATVGRVALVILLPVVLGMGVRQIAGTRALQWHRVIKAAGGVAILAIFTALLVSERASLVEAVGHAFLPVLAYNAAAAALGLGVAWLTRASRERRLSLLMAHQVRQEETGIFLALTVFAAPALALPLLLNSVVGFAFALITIGSVHLAVGRASEGRSSNESIGMTATLPPASIFYQFGVRRVINASGIYTDLGGSIMSAEIMAAWSELNLDWVRMTELLDATGHMIADLLDVPSARITPSASSAIALAVAACMSGDDGARWEQLPDTQGMRNEVLFQTAQLEGYKYALCARLPGAVLKHAPADQLESAIGASTAAIFHVAHLDGHPGTLALEDVSTIAKRHGVPVIVDQAYLNFPLVPDLRDPALATAAYDTMRDFFLRGADLVCFSAKYFWGPNAGGFVMGREDLVKSVVGLDFTRFESGRWKAFGRAFKMGRFEVVATTLALRAWLSLDHQARLEGYRAQIERFTAALAHLPDITVRPVYFTLDERWISPEGNDGAVNAAVVEFGPDAEASLATVAARLEDMDPSILPFVEDGKMTVVMETVRAPDEMRIAAAIATALHAHAQ